MVKKATKREREREREYKTIAAKPAYASECESNGQIRMEE